MANSTLVLITKPPYGLEEAFAGLRLALAFAVNGMKTTIVMMEDGVYNAVKDQKAEAIEMPSNIDATKDLFEFEVNVFAVKEDLASRGIPENRVFEGVNVISGSELKKLATEHDVITTF